MGAMGSFFLHTAWMRRGLVESNILDIVHNARGRYGAVGSSVRHAARGRSGIVGAIFNSLSDYVNKS